MLSTTKETKGKVKMANKGMDKNGYVTDFTKLSEFNVDMVRSAIKALSEHCATYGMQESNTREVCISGSAVTGKSTFEVEGITVENNWTVDYYGNITFPAPTNFGER